ncbi:MAG TPA: hypothetical protein VM915_09500 [Verrucomicrobiae bacterium]|nr:hypothetical protein [Verrucomicrobiae bacterium]
MPLYLVLTVWSTFLVLKRHEVTVPAYMFGVDEEQIRRHPLP